ncbi:MAG: hypothetical protein CVV51_02685 [Spirochaetae bacterium HGW-Spirochaetae-7]|jgi:hypothetical protein|nr:MAG: hypothetical protein CVV51_02685 [Spirochaetae bacterium HGW-Spirochaetae-7]
MKRYTHSIFIFAIVAALGAIAYFYASSIHDRASNEPVRFRTLEAGAKPSDPKAATDTGFGSRETSSIPLEPNETLLDLYSFNLDYDDEEEQVLVIRESDDPSGTIHIVLADYSPFSKKWGRSWKGDTLITKVKTFQVSVNDLIGDHNLNIVCSGMNDANEQTMTIYWKAQELDQRQGTTFMKIFEQAANAVLVESSERPDSYKLGQSNADSWPVSVWRSDAASGNYLDQLKETWRWSFADKSYILASAERIPGASIARKKAETILDGTADTFKTFLEGTWYKEASDPLSKDALFITFQSRDDSIMFSGDGIIEVYAWENSNPTRYGLYIASSNQSVRNLRRLMDIELATTDSVNVRVFQDYRIKADISGRWDGRYRKLGTEMAKSFKRPPAMAMAANLELSGRFEADDGSSIVFAGNSYDYETAGVTERGTWAVFVLDGSTILDMRRSAGEARETLRRSWIAVKTVRQEAGGTSLEALSLTEAKVGIHGIERAQMPPVLFRKR